MIRVLTAHKVLWSFLMVIVLATLLCCYLALQYRFDGLAVKKAGLVREVSALRGEVVLRELENRELSSLDRITQIAEQMGMGYAQVLHKVKQTGSK